MKSITLKAVGNLDMAGIKNPFEFVLEQIQANIVFGNLESMPTKNENLFSMVLNMANDSLVDVKHNDLWDHFCGIGIGRVGNFIIERIDNKSICFLGYAWDYLNLSEGCNIINEARILHDIEEQRANVDFIICSMHWGYDGEIYPLPSQRELAHRMIDKGCNLILGHHPAIQGIEEWNGGLIVYSLGDFVKCGLPEDRRKSFILEVEFTGNRLNAYDIIPVQIGDDGKPRPDNSRDVINLIDQRSKIFNIRNYAFTWGLKHVRKDMGDEFRKELSGIIES